MMHYISNSKNNIHNKKYYNRVGIGNVTDNLKSENLVFITKEIDAIDDLEKNKILFDIFNNFKKKVKNSDTYLNGKTC